MGKYRIFEMDNRKTRILHHSLDLENVEILARAYGYKHLGTPITCGYEPMHGIYEFDVDFSNNIINDMKKEKVSEVDFLSEFLRRKNNLRELFKKKF